MDKPKMIIFDYGQTLINEPAFNGEKGIKAVMQYAVKNKYKMTPQQIQIQAEKLNQELGRWFSAGNKRVTETEISEKSFFAYLYESNGIELSIPYCEAEKVFWDAAAPGTATYGIEEFLMFLKRQGIRTGVISNISYSGNTLEERIGKVLTYNEFEFIIASSEYLFRKPDKRIFNLALEKAGLGAGEAWYVGDRYEYDIVGAKSAGIFPVWYMGALKSEENVNGEEDVLKISCWSQLEEYITDIK